LQLLYKQKKLYRFLPNLKSDVLFSIIIPVYNSEKYLKTCIESVQKQSLKNLEIILVEDKSTDSSRKICNFFLKKHNNIKLIIHKKRYGVSSSRNEGIEAAIGQYIIFIDSDDYLVSDSLKKIENLILKNDNLDIIFLNSHFTKLGNNLIKSENIFNNDNGSKKKNINNLTVLLKKKYSPIECWRYIYKKNFLIKKKLFFIDKINLGEDQEFITKVLCSANNLLIYFKPFYCFRIGSGNLSARIGYDPAISLLKVVNHMCKLIKKNNFSKLKNEFIKQKIYKPLSELKPQLMTLNKTQIYKLSEFIKKNNSNFKILDNFFKKGDIFFFIKKYGKTKGLLMFKSFMTKKIEFLIRKNKFKKIYIFGLNMYSKGIISIANKANFLIRGILDNNEQLKIKRLMGIKIISPRIFFRGNQEKILELFVIISNQQKKNVIKIYKQLKSYGLKKNQIIHINFYNPNELFIK